MSEDLIFLKAAAWFVLAFLGGAWPGEPAAKNGGTGRIDVITNPPA